MRDVAPRFENRLFLSATPHNGHSNSFSALLELLDPQRFTRGVPVKNVRQLEPVMVRRLKAQLQEAGGAENYPVRRVVRIALSRREDEWIDEDGRSLGRGPAVELELAEKLRRYTSSEFGMAGSWVDRKLPLLRLPIEQARSVVRSDLGWIRRIAVLVALVPAFLVRYLAGRAS